MKQIAKVEIIDADRKEIYKWLRKREVYLPMKDVFEMSKQKVVDFHGDYEYALEFFNYLQNNPPNSARLIIDVSYDTRGTVWYSAG